MAAYPEAEFDFLWREYLEVFEGFDDLTLARWMAQTLGQFEGRCWRMSHPLMGAYRLAAYVGNQRQIWLKRLATPPIAYTESNCCRAPFFPLLTRDVEESGLLCVHCGATLLAWDDLPGELQPALSEWAARYRPVHAVSHDEAAQRENRREYDKAFSAAAEEAEKLLKDAGTMLAPKFLEYYPAIVWEDQDECLDVRAEDIRTD